MGRTIEQMVRTKQAARKTTGGKAPPQAAGRQGSTKSRPELWRSQETASLSPGNGRTARNPPLPKVVEAHHQQDEFCTNRTSVCAREAFPAPLDNAVDALRRTLPDKTGRRFANVRRTRQTLHVESERHRTCSSTAQLQPLAITWGREENQQTVAIVILR